LGSFCHAHIRFVFFAEKAMSRASHKVLHALPPSLPDETLFSRIARFHILTGGGPPKDTVARLFGNGFSITASGLPNRLSALCSHFEEAETPLAVVFENTAYSYYRPFLSEKRAELLLADMLDLDARGLKTRLGIIASRVGASNPLRLCRECVIADVEGAGVAYWHRVHQAPGVLVCPTHKEPLDDCSRAAQFSRHALWLPRDVPLALIQPAAAFSAPQRNALLNISTATAALIDASLLPLSAYELQMFYLRQAGERGLTTQNGRVRQREFLELFRSAWECLTEHPEFRSFLYVHALWPSSLLRKPRQAKHPLKHILVGLALFKSWSGFLNQYTRYVSDSGMSHSVNGEPLLRRARREIEKSERISMAVKMVVRNGSSLRAAAKELDLDTTTVRIYIEAAGEHASRRPKWVTDANERQAGARLEQGDDIDAIARDLGLSYSTVWRLLAACPGRRDKRQASIQSRLQHEYRSRWLSALFSSVEHSIKLASSLSDLNI
jgi:transposase